MTRLFLSLFIFIIITLIFGCKRKVSELTLEDINIENDSSKLTNRVAPTIIWESPNVIIYGDSSIESKKIFWTRIKVNLYNSFEDYQADSIFKGISAQIDYNSNKTANRFKTVINNNYKDSEVHFGGYYSFASWGCGTACQNSAIVDFRDGKVYDGPNASLGYEYRFDSRLLIVNPPDSLGFVDDCSYCEPEIWIWDEGKKRFNKKNVR